MRNIEPSRSFRANKLINELKRKEAMFGNADDAGETKRNIRFVLTNEINEQIILFENGIIDYNEAFRSITSILQKYCQSRSTGKGC